MIASETSNANDIPI